MRIILATAILLMSASQVFAQRTQSSRLTTNSLEQASVTIDKAANSKDIDTTLSQLSSNASITVSYTLNSETQEIVYSKDTYAEHLKNAWARCKSASYKRWKTVYEIAEDGQSAISTFTFQQTATMKDTGETFRSTGKQVHKIRLINGAPMVVKVHVTILYQ